MHILQSAQREAFPDDYAKLVADRPVASESKLARLSPKLDDAGIIRPNGRLQLSTVLPYDTRHPIVLPRQHAITRLSIANQHEELHHAEGVNHTLASLSKRSWIIGAREAIRQSEQEYNFCKRQKVKASEQIIAPLPPVCIDTSIRPFEKVSVDFAGPFRTINGRGKPHHKRYMCLFTCMTTRAVHIEMATSLETDSFLHAYFRMANRRGYPSVVYSDNGMSFTGAVNELKHLVEDLDQDRITGSTSVGGRSLFFNPPAPGHFGGVHESLVKSAKRSSYAILQNTDVTDKELETCFTGVENLLNSRPLTYQSSDHRDDVPLTPGQFLYGTPGGDFPPSAVDSTSFSLKGRWRQFQDLVKHFRQRWMQKWLPMLHLRQKWHLEQRDITVGDTVLVVANDTPRGKWLMARDTNVYPGKDGHSGLSCKTPTRYSTTVNEQAMSK